MDKKLIDKINFYAKKQREQGLSDDEKIIQNKLRQQYLTEFKNQFRGMLQNIEIVDGDNIVN